jgi:2-hydroxy-3-oxopropionate reductase
MSKPTIGFIGLGLMGYAMCHRLLSLGYDVNIIANKSRANIEKAIKLGAKEHQTNQDLAKHSDVIMLCLGTSDSVEKVMLDGQGVIEGVKEQSIVIDFGTSLPQSTQKIAASLSKKNVFYLDAPLGRTPAHAYDGLLNIMCGGDKKAFEQVEPILADLGENVFHVGESGAGHSLKLLNNFVGMTMATAIGESFVIAEKVGIDPLALYDVMSKGPLHSGMMDFVKANAIDGDCNQLAFAIKNAKKDIGYYRAMVAANNMDSVMSKSTNDVLSEATNNGHGDKMVSQIIDYFESIYQDQA